MEAKKEKSNKGLIITIVVLIVLLLGTIGYICYDKFYVNKTDESDERPVVEKVKKLSEEEILKLHESLTTEDRIYGLYIDKNVDINSINAYSIMPYVILNYLNDQKVTIEEDSMISYPDGNNIKISDNATKIDKKEVDEYIKKKFNTDRSFELTEDELFKGYSSIGRLGEIREMRENDKRICYIYSFNDNSYYITNKCNGYGTSSRVYSKYIKSEQNNGEIYIYDNAFVETAGESGRSIAKSFSLNSNYPGVIFKTGNNIDINHDNYEKYFSNDTVEINENSVFTDFSDEINTYKHTFKKANDGNYYWTSSEIVE